MSEFTCDRCHYTTEHISNFKRHLKKKTPCKTVFSAVAREDIMSQFTLDKPHKCKECNKAFSSYQGKYQHKKYCKGKSDDVTIQDSSDNNDNPLIQMVMELRNEVECLKKDQKTVVNHNTNIVNTTQNNNIHVLNSFGSEDKCHLTDRFLATCLRRTSKGFVQLLEKLHWDPSVPANANIRISNRKLPLAEVQEAGKWRFVPREKAINDMIDKGQDILSEHFEDHQDEIRSNVSDSLWEHITRWMEKMQDKDKTTIQDLLIEIYCLILNNS